MLGWKRARDLLLTGTTRVGSLVLPHQKGSTGIKVDYNNPAYTWRDLEGPIRPKATGAGSPTLTAFRGNIREFAFAANDIVDMTFHWPHDWVPGSDAFIHLHWGHNGTNISGQFQVTYRHAWSKGHNQSDIPSDTSLVHTIPAASLTAVPQHRHRIDEIQLSASSPTASQINTNDLEPDGLLEISMITNEIPTITGGAAKPFIFYCDIHYLSTNVGTKNRAPNFWT